MMFEDPSQYGEGMFLLKHYASNKPKNKFLVDIGAKGKSLSNSYSLIKYGLWEAVLIEPHPESFEGLMEDFSFASPNRVKFLNLAISNKTGLHDFYLHDTPGHSSLIHQKIPARLNEVNKGKESIGRSIKVQVARIGELVDLGVIPLDLELLLIDTEGCDPLIISDMLRSTVLRPRMLLWEAQREGMDQGADGTRELLAHHGYQKIHQTVANEFWEVKAGV